MTEVLGSGVQTLRKINFCFYSLAEVQKNLRVLLNEDEDEFAPLLLSQLKFRFLHK